MPFGIDPNDLPTKNPSLMTRCCVCDTSWECARGRLAAAQLLENSESHTPAFLNLPFQIFNGYSFENPKQFTHNAARR